MASHDAIQSSRSELKFEIDESQTSAIRAFLLTYLRPDPNCSDGTYPVTSVYLDSEDRLLYRQTQEGIRNRYKLRVRFYDDLTTSPAFLEIKGRDGQAVKKKRARVDRHTAAKMLQGDRVSLPQTSGASCTTSDWEAFDEFRRLRDRIGATGQTYVSYQREAYLSPDNTNCRATFDRRLKTSGYQPDPILRLPETWVEAGSENQVVFELKYTDEVPRWMEVLVRTFGLVAGPFPKYVTCRDSLREEEIRQRDPSLATSDSSGDFHGVS
ncbi:MAG: polyphosphate polymerase domain-containing protein [Planctomycetota bacterium]